MSNLKSIPSKDAQNDIVELSNKISAFQKGEIHEERFKHFRLTRGVYGQRQLGVHMFRTKIPFGKLTSDQLTRLADVSEKYTNGNLHLTTRQNIQMHHVKLKDATAIWTDLAEKGVTAREACGNTVRNITASPTAGIDLHEPFDVSPYVQATYEYFLRNPICQDMGRKIKIAFSSSIHDSAFGYFHDFGFIPKIEVQNGKELRGFKVLIGGGLGAQSIIAPTAYDFLPADQIIPFMEAAIRVFDRYGEREKRFKARMKYLVKKLGLEAFMELVNDERKGIAKQSFPIDASSWKESESPTLTLLEQLPEIDLLEFDVWKITNVKAQKGNSLLSVQVRVPLGDIQADTARKFSALVKKYAADDIRISVNQGFILRHIDEKALPFLFAGLSQLNLAKPGFDSIADITACPGTDTCNLAVTNSTGLAIQLENMIEEDFPELLQNEEIKIKISGCMNACGQHMAANIGLHGSSIKRQDKVIPAMQVVLGGGVDPNGVGFIAEKVIKLPTKRIPQSIQVILNDFIENALEGEAFNEFYQRLGKRYFYTLLKPLSELETLANEDYFDWGEEKKYIQAIGVGECAGVSYDVVGSILNDAKEKVELAWEALQEGEYADSIYHSYSAYVIGAKGLLLSKDVKCNTQINILSDFQTHWIDAGDFDFDGDFKTQVLALKKQEPSLEMAKKYGTEAITFVNKVLSLRGIKEDESGKDKMVVLNYYKA